MWTWVWILTGSTIPDPLVLQKHEVRKVGRNECPECGGQLASQTSTELCCSKCGVAITVGKNESGKIVWARICPSEEKEGHITAAT